MDIDLILHISRAICGKVSKIGLDYSEDISVIAVGKSLKPFITDITQRRILYLLTIKRFYLPYIQSAISVMRRSIRVR
jgi:hypothetical protein